MTNQKGVLIKDANGNVTEKRVYGGDLSNLTQQLTVEGVIFVIYDDSDPVFVGTAMPPLPPPIEDRLAALETAVSAVALQANVKISLPVSGTNLS